MATTKKPAPPKPAKPPKEAGVYFSRTKNDETDMARVYLPGPKQWSKGHLQSRDAKAVLEQNVHNGKLPATWVEKNPVITWRAISGSDASPQGGGGGGPGPIK